MGTAVRRKLTEAAWRLRFARFVLLLAWAAAIILAGACLWQVAAWTHPAWPEPRLGIISLVGLALAALGALVSWLDHRAVARELDRRARAKDRYLSLLDVAADSPVHPLIEREAEAFSAQLSLRGLFRPRVPRTPLFIAGLAAVSFLAIFQIQRGQRDALADEQAEAEALLTQADQILKNPDTPLDPEVREELEKAWQKVADSTEPKRDAFRAISELEKKLAAAAQATALTDADRAALAQALAAQHARLAQALRDGANDDAADQAASLDPEELAKALEEAAKHRESNRLQDLTRQAAPQAQQSLVQILSAPSNARKLQQALREAKAGQNSSQPGQNQPQLAQGLPSDAPPGKEKGQSGDANRPPEDGSPGSENDRGKGDEINQERERLAQQSAEQQTLNSISGQGPSSVAASQFTGDGAGGSQRAHTGVDQAAIAAALQEINRENIPPGSQILVRRYFESIRPKE